MSVSNKQEMGERINERMTDLNLSNVAVADFVGLSKHVDIIVNYN